ncbi:MAG: undecaprenyl-diphosphate phosphatase [bacterium]
MNILIFIIFIQIILESLPVSSSGHLALVSNFYKSNLSDHIDYFLHGPTIIILMIVFYKEWSRPLGFLIKGFFKKNRILGQVFGKVVAERPVDDNRCEFRSNINQPIQISSSRVVPAAPKPMANAGQALYRGTYKKLLNIFFKIVPFIFVANFITTLIWFLVKTFLEKQIWFSSYITLLLGFCVTSIFLFLLRFKFLNKTEFTFIFKAVILGLVQGMALLPGISRFASVYATARLLNISNRRAFQITFLLQFPLIVAGFFLGFYKLAKVPEFFKMFTLPVNLSIFTATIISLGILFWCKKLAYTQKLWRFAFYMFIPILFSIYILFYR